MVNDEWLCGKKEKLLREGKKVTINIVLKSVGKESSSNGGVSFKKKGESKKQKLKL